MLTPWQLATVKIYLFSSDFGGGTFLNGNLVLTLPLSNYLYFLTRTRSSLGRTKISSVPAMGTSHQRSAVIRK